MSKQEVILCTKLETSLARAIEKCQHDKLFILTDEHTSRLCMPVLRQTNYLKEAVEITIGAGDVHKTLESLAAVWQVLSSQGATRHSLLINIGGGMVTDLGGFAAATFKRGITYINIPTTLLAMVDASVGGKTGINFNGLKNEVGVFAPAASVLIETEFLRSLNAENFISGYAEMLKHGLISNTEHWAELLNFNTQAIDYDHLKQLVGQSVQIKEEIVMQDPFEHGIRKALNLGHTAGHAIESLALAENRPLLHGYAVAWGIVCELYLSHIKAGFPKDKMRQTIQFIQENYGVFAFDCKQYDQLYALMQHDKKNTAGAINFTLLEDIGVIRINQTADKETIFEMFDFYRECMGV
ncbi:MAG: 3-dehydroquinate synthase [Bacteroides sp.]|uniref:3-dehydroquinate synthase n=1 Tax=Bacteroides sp. TaxID=29523 RepID=UPI001B49479E|nr:3-dehydroquinate synthase [Bacteroides sp.]MBP6065849.1 3-dehydroquinate synthase [Bacteroides sp.]